MAFLRLYPSILRKFRGPPIEALGKTISFLQALFTRSPAFHPYVTHMPSNNLPEDPVHRYRVAHVLEMRLIKTIEHLLLFFYGDVNIVSQYIQRCSADLIPPPQFVVSARKPEDNTPVPYGVQGFNNSVPGGARVWKNPSSASAWRLRQEHDALKLNLTKCEHAIRRRQHLATQPPRSAPLPSQPNLAPLLPSFPTQPLPTTLSHPVPQPPRSNPTLGQPSRPPQVFHVPPPATQPPVPQPTASPPRIVTHPSASPAESADLRAEINRLEAKVAQLIELVSSKQ